MKKLILFLFILFPKLLSAQVLTAVFDINSTYPITQPFNLANRSLSVHTFTWTIQQIGVTVPIMTGCSFNIETSTNGVVGWTVQNTQSCLSAGTSGYITFVGNWFRINATSFTFSQGIPVLTINYAAYVNNPTSVPANLNPTTLNNEQYCNTYTGTSASVQITNCANAIPVTGGIVNATGIQGAQNWTTDVFNGITKLIDFKCGATTYTVSATSTIPTTVNFNPSNGCIFKPQSGITIYFQGRINANLTQQFCDLSLGGICTTQAGAQQTVWSPHWFGAVNDNDSIDSTIAIQAAINAMRNLGRGPGYFSNSQGSIISIQSGSYAIGCLDITNSSGFEIVGQGKRRTTFYVDKQSTPCNTFDLSLSNNFHIKGISINGTKTNGTQPTVTPITGILMATGSSSSFPCNANVLEDVTIEGYFTKGNVYDYGCTDIRIEKSILAQQLLTQGALVLTSSNTGSISSSFQTIGMGNQPTGEIDVIATELHAAANASTSSSAIILDGVYKTGFHGGLVGSNGGNNTIGAVKFTGVNHTVAFINTQFYSDLSPAKYAFDNNNGGTVTDFGSINVDYGMSGGYGTAMTVGTFIRPAIIGNFPVTGTDIPDQFRAVTPSSYTFGTLPSFPITGECVWITDSNQASYNGNITAGSGGNKGLACYNGTNWTMH